MPGERKSMATWSKKTYEMAAAAVQSSRDKRPMVDHGVDKVMWRLIEEFEEDNDRFDRELFLKAAGWEDE